MPTAALALRIAEHEALVSACMSPDLAQPDVHALSRARALLPDGAPMS